MITDNWIKSEVIIVDWCCMYKLNGESADHLLLHCIIAKELWDLSLCLFGVTWLMPDSIIAMLASWKGKLGNHRSGKLWTTALSCSCVVFGKSGIFVLLRERSYPYHLSSFFFSRCYTVIQLDFQFL